MIALLLALLTHPIASGCDASLAAHVYHPERLTVLASCLRVTGTIVDATHGKRKDGQRHEADGDNHGWLKLDQPFADLLNAGNRSNEGANLVFEIPCQYRVTQADAKAACKGYHSPITIPPVGSHVAIVGVYVQETKHAKWRELHPVTSITVMR